MSVPSEIRTRRLLLRRPLPADTEPFVEVHTSPDTHVFPGVAPRDRAQSLRLLDGIQSDWDARGVGYWTVLSVTSGDVLGFGGLRECVDDAEDVLNLYFRFLPAAWGRGYAPEMGHAALRWAHRNRPGLPVVIATSVRNAPAIRVADKLGFGRVRERLHEGVPEVLYRWSVPEPLR
ncbi:GNAT family N-acetyltransferase [Saccharopolyspora sp. TS4A08]|uniref:GNAT family N-acetyltransferase n=1 Tax=Saccharopolyspora ipomoeae TaxID=3042027 RepID=A0ABT6PL17_9PSEU|nr:GNAT family N-acetyltransferase [Saccharopolyspora sp. TS4A08]MDI2028681.1 GNAT family N-acetyltransferase [Saccharopolyspora sp. TS4A08]